MKKKIVVGLTASFLASATHAALIDFNSAGDLANRFSLNTNNGNPVKFTQVMAGGLGNSGAVDYLPTTESDHTTAVFNEQSFSFENPGDSITVSHFLLRQDATAIQTPWTHLGITGDTSERLDAGSAENSYASIRFEPVGGALATDVFVRAETKVNGGGRLRTTLSSPLSLDAGNWYFVSTTFTFESNASIAVSTTLEDWGTDGSAFLSTLLEVPPTSIANSGLDSVNGDGTVWGAFRDFNEGGANLSDNFSVIPEPTSLLAATLVFMIAALRRRP
ncbi:MAG: hypothetical protein AB7N71_02275 [Phycisphaerae bacterium]